MISLFAGKTFSLILQILLVVAAVLVFSYFDPLGLLVKKKKTLMNTPIQVQSIKEIGQLISAEYYGEVIASLDEVIQTEKDTIVYRFISITDDLHEEFVDAIDSLATTDPNIKRNEIWDKFKGANPGLISNPEFDAYLYYIDEKLKDNKYNKKDLSRELSDRSKRTLIRKLYRNKNDWLTKLEDIETDDFVNVRKKKIETVNNKKYRRSRLVIIGRGSVKAGFDFGEFSERNFRYHKPSRTIHFIGLKPQILSATINPWFIPEERVEGFEFLIAERGARLNPEYTYKVKKRCLDKLTFQATKKNILERARENAETNLQAFFSLLFEEGEEIRKVTFHADLLEYTLDVIRADSVIRNEEVVTIDNTLFDYYRSNKTTRNRFKKMSDFTDSLKMESLIINDVYMSLHSFSALLFQIIRDRYIDAADISYIMDRNIDSLDSVKLEKFNEQKGYINDSLFMTQMKKWEKNMLLDSAWHSRIFNDIESISNEDLIQNKRFNDSINADVGKFIKQLKTVCEKWNVGFDTAYFSKHQCDKIKLRDSVLDFEPFQSIYKARENHIADSISEAAKLAEEETAQIAKK